MPEIRLNFDRLRPQFFHSVKETRMLTEQITELALLLLTCSRLGGLGGPVADFIHLRVFLRLFQIGNHVRDNGCER